MLIEANFIHGLTYAIRTGDIHYGKNFAYWIAHDLGLDIIEPAQWPILLKLALLTNYVNAKPAA